MFLRSLKHSKNQVCHALKALFDGRFKESLVYHIKNNNAYNGTAFLKYAFY